LQTKGHADEIHLEKDFVEFETFVKDKLQSLGTATLGLTHQLEVAEANMIWNEGCLAIVDTWLEEAVSEMTTTTVTQRPTTTPTTTTIKTTTATTSSASTFTVLGFVSLISAAWIVA